MGMFFPDDPDYFPNRRPTGFKRYSQVLERDWKRLIMGNLLTVGSLLPFALGVGYAVLSSSILVLLPVCVLGGIIAGPFVACMYDMILRGLRDNVDDWWYSYKKAMKQNFRAAILPGVVMCLFLGFYIFCCAMLWWAPGNPGLGTVAVMLISALIVIMVFTVWWPQVVLFDQKHGIRLKNCLLFCIRYLKPSLIAAAVQLLWWLFLVVMLPWSGYVIPFIGIWYILYLSTFLIYDRLDEAFAIEERIAEAFPEQIPVYGEE
jgi:uncharacterized membrane protein YesL